MFTMTPRLIVSFIHEHVGADDGFLEHSLLMQQRGPIYSSVINSYDPPNLYVVFTSEEMANVT